MTLLKPGQNCWRVERAGRGAMIVDGEAYFRAVKAAIVRAERSVYIIGWDFDRRLRLQRCHERVAPEAPDVIMDLLQYLIRARPELEVRVLKWNLALLSALGRGILPSVIRSWRTDRRLQLRLDANHPPGACHHQKLLVVDDQVAFCGGIDLASNRWDTRAHADDEPGRRLPEGRRYAPHHDMMMAVDGPAAAALGDLARERWRHATGERPKRPRASGDAWPEDVLPDPEFRDVDVAIARTLPKYGGRPEVREIERLHLDAIAAARDAIYIENQYVAPTGGIIEALSARLAEPDGPEVVMVSASESASWLEQHTMDAARDLAVQELRKSDRHDRFRVYARVTESGGRVIVHSKTMVVDDRLLRVGSANLNHRSMGFDSECDLAIDAETGTSGEDRTRRAIRGYRDGLLSEHLRVPVERVSAAIDESGSLVRAVESLRAEEPGRCLRELPPTRVSGLEAFAENRIVDPARPEQADRSSRLFFDWARNRIPPF